MRKQSIVAVAGALAIAASGAGVATAAKHHSGKKGAHRSSASRLDDGKQYLAQSGITEARAIKAAQSAASGALNEVDLEMVGGRLAWNVDVGAKDVKVDASTGKVLRVDADD